MHGHWLKTNKISGDYIAIDIPPARFSQTVRLLVGVGLSGFNVTLPHKESALALADHKTERATKIGAANTLIIDADGKINADNTDGCGFIAEPKKQQQKLGPSSGPSAGFGSRWCCTRDLGVIAGSWRT